jgi:hypothetical protein
LGRTSGDVAWVFAKIECFLAENQCNCIVQSSGQHSIRTPAASSGVVAT